MTLSDGSAEEYDTVLAAVGRYADTEKLGLANAGVAINPKNGKLPCKFEQTNVPHVYGIGDIVDGEAELTPVAIQVRTKRKTGGGVRAARRAEQAAQRAPCAPQSAQRFRRAPCAFADHTFTVVPPPPLYLLPSLTLASRSPREDHLM